jgi:zinc transporter ZupT
MIVLFLAVLAALAALAGGFVAIKSRSYINLALGFTAGIILGLVAFDLLPEIFEITKSDNLDIIWPMTALVSGFCSFILPKK